MYRFFRMVSRLLLLGVFACAVFVGACLLLNLRTPAATELTQSRQLMNPPKPVDDVIALRVVTYNVHDLYIESSHRQERMAAIGETLAALEPDIVALQEAFIARDRQKLAEALAAAGLEYNHYFDSGLVGSGLFVLSRFPFVERHFHRYSFGGKPYRVDHGDWWAGKGVALVRVQLPEGIGYLDLFNTHLHASYEDDKYNSTRLSQIQELSAYVNAAETGTSPALLLGDMNCKNGSAHYRILVEGAGLQRMMTREETGVDHVFAAENNRYEFSVFRTQPITDTVEVDGKTIEMSDHTGWLSVVRVIPAEKLKMDDRSRFAAKR